MTEMPLPGPESFRPHVGSEFAVDHRGEPILLRLADVVDRGTASGMHQFVLLFHGPARRVLPDAIYALQHPALGTLEIFIAPIAGSDGVRTVYQACFSRPA